MLPNIPSPHPDRRRGSVLLLVLIFTSLLATIAASYGGTVDAALDGPSMINFGSTAGKVDITSLFENFN
ncbi:MAG: hypothetical protein ACPGQD_02835 [Planctomycetota bacterium]